MIEIPYGINEVNNIAGLFSDATRHFMIDGVDAFVTFLI